MSAFSFSRGGERPFPRTPGSGATIEGKSKHWAVNLQDGVHGVTGAFIGMTALLCDFLRIL